MRFAGRVVLVTGGGSGIGRAIASRFASEGARVAVNDIRAEAAEATVKALGGEARAVVADVADSVRVRAMVEEVARVFGGLDVLVNNAGIGETNPAGREALAVKIETRVAEMMAGTRETHWDITQNLSDEAWARMLAVHLNGTFYCTREALKLMSRVNRGAIVNISSVAGLMGIEVASHYGAAKAGILGFTRSVAREVASRGIRVNAICPGFVDTPILDPMPPVTRLLAERQTPFGRLGRPEEIAAAAAFLASDEASFITGQWLSPNGGLLTV
ncbi:MAG TPA: SDR family NAD(P)-dependent oxidoreductase [Candidatus Binatia bacterium]|nr:SDR family NAD(P)-dependent oxidoreductase [Candidatus Binatia bacterium]